MHVSIDVFDMLFGCLLFLVVLRCRVRVSFLCLACAALCAFVLLRLFSFCVSARVNASVVEFVELVVGTFGASGVR